jgi:chemotaxis methyl-accepting protein methylase
MENEKIEISTKNYSRFQGASQLIDYFSNTDNVISFDRSLFVHTRFFNDGVEFDHDLPLMHLILFRNQFIYFNSTLQHKVCEKLYNKLTSKGLLALGILEEIELNINNKFTVLNKEESLYQRKS